MLTYLNARGVHGVCKYDTTLLSRCYFFKLFTRLETLRSKTNIFNPNYLISAAWLTKQSPHDHDEKDLKMWAYFFDPIKKLQNVFEGAIPCSVPLQWRRTQQPVATRRRSRDVFTFSGACCCCRWLEDHVASRCRKSPFGQRSLQVSWVFNVDNASMLILSLKIN